MEKNGIIELDGMEFRAFHGCLDSEKENGNTFTVDFRGMTDMSKAASDDRLEDTADYGILYRIIAGEMEKRSDLLEHVAGRILRRLFADFPCIESVALELTKDNPPMGADCLGAGIAVTVSRADFE